MIFQTKKLTQLKQLQAIIIKKHPEIICNSSTKNQHQKSQLNRFSQLIQNIGLQWMRVFISMTEQWINSSCQKFLKLLNMLQGIDEYYAQSELDKTCLYLQEVKYKFLTSLQNMKNLYLIIPQYSHSAMKKNSFIKQQILGQKKRSVSIKSLQKQRSKSKGRKLSFFTKKTEPPNLFQTFLKDKSNMNKTIKKVKKQQNATQSTSFYKTFSNLNQKKQYSSFFYDKQNQKQSPYTTNLNVTASSTSYNLKKNIQQKLLSSTFTSSFTQKLKEQKINSASKVQNEKNQQKNSNKEIYNKDEEINFKKQMNELQKKLNYKIDQVLKQIKQSKKQLPNKQKTQTKIIKKLQNKILQQDNKNNEKQKEIPQANFKEKAQLQDQDRVQRKSQTKKSANIGLKDNSIIKSNKSQNKKQKRESNQITSSNNSNLSHHQSQNQLENIELSNKELIKKSKVQKSPQNYLIKSNMEKQIQKYQKATNKFALPINKTFLSLFSKKYVQFCQNNKLQPIKQILKNVQNIVQNEKKFVVQSIQKLQKMLKMKLSQQKRQKLVAYIKDFIFCMNQVYLKLENEESKKSINLKMELIQKLYQKV